MPSVMNNEVLLKNRVENGMLAACLFIRSLTNVKLIPATIGPFDGKVGATILDGKFFITSPNQHFIFCPPLGDKRRMRLRADSHYADDDPILWPQPYNTYFSHYAAIPRPGSLPLHDIIWWEPTRDHFVLCRDEGAIIRGLGKLSNTKIFTLRASVDLLLDRVERYRSNAPPNRIPPILEPDVKMMEHGLTRLQSVYTNFRQMEFGVRDVQRIWLEIMAMLDYMEIFKLKMDGLLGNWPPAQVADTIGAFTNDLRVAQDLFLAGLPYWLIRPLSDFTNQNILKIVHLCNADKYLTVKDHQFPYPVIFEGPATSIEKFQTIHHYGWNFLCYADSFNIPISTAGIQQSASMAQTPSSSMVLACSPAACSSRQRPPSSVSR